MTRPRPRYPSDDKPRVQRSAPGRVRLALWITTETRERLVRLSAESGATQAETVDVALQLLGCDRS